MKKEVLETTDGKYIVYRDEKTNKIINTVYVYRKKF